MQNPAQESSVSAIRKVKERVTSDDSRMFLAAFPHCYGAIPGATSGWLLMISGPLLLSSPIAMV